MKRFVTQFYGYFAALAAVFVLALVPAMQASAAGTKTGSGSVGLQGVISSAPPTTPATISTPTNGQVFDSIPITVAGLCTSGLLVKIFDNGVFMGSTVCQNGSYSLKIDLFDGANQLIARVFDALDQAGPDSNSISVTFNDNQFNNTSAQLLQLTSDYANRGANPGDTLTWPFIISGGTGPYAVSVDWGDGKPQDLISLQFAGSFNTSHVYDSAGLYTVTLKATDKNGLAAYLQVVATANGAITSSSSSASSGGTTKITINAKIPLLLTAGLVLANAFSFWLGQRYSLTRLRRKLEQADY